MNARKFSSVLVFLCCVFVVAPLFASSPRIVRLSFVQGDVRLDRNAGNGLEQAILNSPVPEGGRLVTGNNGYAEVEFENGSTLRLAGAAEVDFPQLTADSDGHLLTLIDVRTGTAYLNAKLEKHAQYRVAMHGGPDVQLRKSSRLRFQVSDAQAAVAVFDGEVSIPEREKQVAVKKGDTLTLDFGAASHYQIAKNIEPQPADQWNREREGEHQVQFSRAESNNTYGYYGYGAGDLLAYGDYSFIPGYGYMWRPYGYDMGWDPFGWGAWSFYPGWGWTYISAYPWGWAPYRYGSWYNIAGYGWMWQPGYGNVWNAVPVVVNPPGSFRPLRPPKPGPGPTTIVANAPPPGMTPNAITSGQTATQPPVRRPVINRPGSVPRGTHTPPKAVQMPADAARDTGVKPSPAPVPAKPTPTTPPSMSAPTPPVSRPAPEAPSRPAPSSPPHTSAPGPSSHSSYSGGGGHSSFGGGGGSSHVSSGGSSASRR
ncbi:MAG TPA: FecR family protein [Terriglobales bacterium]